MKTRIYTLLLITLSFYSTYAQRSLSGKVIDQDSQEEIISASIVLQYDGKNYSAVSDFDGKFKIDSLPAAKYTVEVKYIGYETYKVNIDLTVTNSVRLEIKLKPDVKVLQDVVIVNNYRLVGSAMPVRGRKSMSPSYAWGYDLADAAEPDVTDDTIGNNDFRMVKTSPFSTFSIDVDDGSYALMRRNVNNKSLPKADEVRTEEFINYFQYNYPYPATTEKPFSVYTEMSACPWNPANQLLHIGIQGYDVKQEKLPPSNLVFLIDVSGSMQGEDRIGLVKKAFSYMVDNLTEQDKVAIVVYAGNSGLILSSTPGNQKQKLKDAVNNLSAGGSTAGGAGIQLAYKTAMDNFIKDGNNRVILCTDGDFNVGISDEQGLIKLIEEKRQSGVFLSVIGCGTGNYQDKKMEQLADHGNGYYGYMDEEAEAKRIFSKQMGATLLTIAKDVKLQVEFNPAWVKEYKLVGYENRKLEDEEFVDDKKDAGELGAGSSVTALYELVLYPQAKALKTEPANNKLQYASFAANDLASINIRYKLPKEDKSTLSIYTLQNTPVSPAQVTSDFNFSAAVAMAGMVLKKAANKGSANMDIAYALATKGKGDDKDGYRTEFIELLSKLKKLDAKQ